MLKPLAAAVALALPLAAAAAPETYTIDPYHTFPHFSLDHLGISTLYGQFNKSTGKVTIDRAAKTGSMEIVVETASVSTGDSDKGSRARSRDEHLRSADFFNVAEFPKATYKGTKFTFAGDNPSVIEGEFTLLGVTKPLSLTVDRFKCNPASANSKERCGGNATGKFKRSDFGMKFGVPNVGDEVTLLVAFEALKD
ncbi:MAG: YceI family protein [Burkholderiales bacterium]